MWNDRYSDEKYVYGTEPNDFLKQVVDQLPKGKVLCLAEGEGRNSVFLAQQGFDATGVDSSSVGLEKAQKLAQQKGVSVTTVHADLNEYVIGDQRWDVIVSIFCHLPPPLRKKVHKELVKGLKPGGVLVLEAYTEKQLQFKTGGPPVAEMMMSLQELKEELTGLEFNIGQELDRVVHEGQYHNGMGAVVQVLAQKK